MNSTLKGLLIFLLSAAITPLGVFLYDETILKALSGHHTGLAAFLFPVIGFFEVGVLKLIFRSVFLAGVIFGLLYGIMAGILGIYDLASPAGWIGLVADLTWSLPNTIFGFVVGNIVYPFFGSPSRDESEDKGWIAYLPRAGSTSSFGRDV